MDKSTKTFERELACERCYGRISRACPNGWAMRTDLEEPDSFPGDGSSLWLLVRPQLGLENHLFIAIFSKHRGERWDGVVKKRWDDLDSVSTVLSVGYIAKEIV